MEYFASYNLYYLNQGTSAEGFWATGGMGLRLADGTTELAEGNYIVRIGDKAGNIVEIPFTVSTADDGDTITVTWGNINNDDAGITTADLNALIAYVSKGTQNTYGDLTVGEEIDGVVWGNINNDDAGITTADLNALIAYVSKGTQNTYGDLTVGEPVDLTITK